MLQAPKIDCDLQLVPFAHLAQTFRLKALVDIRKLYPKVAQHARRFLKKVVANDTAPACEFQFSTGPFLRALVCRTAARQLARLQQGAGGPGAFKRSPRYGRGMAWSSPTA